MLSGTEYQRAVGGRLGVSANSHAWSKALCRRQVSCPSAPTITRHMLCPPAPAITRQVLYPSVPDMAKNVELRDFQNEIGNDEVIDFQQGKKTNIVDYLNGVPDDIRGEITDYLSRGDADVLRITEEKFHHYFHIATFLHNKSLSNACLLFLKLKKSSRQTVTLSGMCECCLEVLHANDIDDARISSSLMAFAEGKDTSPKYAILFLKANDDVSKRAVMIMNLENRYEILQPKVSKVNKFGDGFASCSPLIDGSPYVLISGGSGKSSHVMWKYDVILNKWSECSKLKCARTNHVMASVDNNVYIIGSRECDCVEMYTPKNNHITTVAKLQYAVHSAAFVVFDHNIYIFGGKSKLGCVNCVQCLDTRTNRVTRLSDLPCQCAGGQAVVANDKVFYATGQGHMIKFDPSTGESELCAQQPFRRKHFAIFERNKKVFIIGGVRKDGPLDHESTMCKYCPKKDMWVKKVLSFRKSLTIYTSCTVRYPKKCPVIPFMDLYSPRKS